MRRLGDPLGHRIGSRGFLGGVLSSGPVRYPRLRSFYVDATGGADGDDGRTPDTAWQTIGKVNGETFLPGDYVLFKRGETWVGTLLAFPSSGSFQRPIVISDYGSGALPIIDGNDLVDCVTAVNQNYLLFQNIEVTQGFNNGFLITGCTYIDFIDCDAHDCGNVGLEFDDSSFCSVTRGSFFDTYERVALTTNAGIVVGDNSHDILIKDADCYGGTGVGTSGLSIHNHAGTIYPYNIILQNCNFYNNENAGLWMDKADATVDADRNILVENCTSYGNTAFGIRAWNAGAAFLDGVTFAECIVRDNGSNAFRVRADNVRIQQTLFSSAVNRPIWVTGCKSMTFLNVTIYTTAAVVGDFLVVIENARTEDFVMRNCIGRAESTAVNQISVVAGVPGAEVDIDYSLWGYIFAATRWWWLGVAKNWADWLTDSGQDANSPAPADPLFVDPASNDFTLQAGSPAIDAGTPVGLPFLGSAPDIGAFERE